MTCLCPVCMESFEVEPVVRGERGWIYRALALAQDTHDAVNPKCKRAQFIFVMDKA